MRCIGKIADLRTQIVGEAFKKFAYKAGRNLTHNGRNDTASAAINALGDPVLPPDGIRAAARRLQPYIVNVPKEPFRRLCTAGRVQALNPARFDEQFMRLMPEATKSLYSDALGLDWSDESFRTNEQNMF